MTTPPSVARQFIFGRAAVEPVRVAYSLDETAQAWGRTSDQVARAIHHGYVDARHNGRFYLIAGATIRDIAIGEPLIPINDHREVVQPDVSYTYADLAVMFGWSAQAVRRLNYNGRLVPDVNNSTRPMFSGALIRAYLDGRDEPISYHASA